MLSFNASNYVLKFPPLADKKGSSLPGSPRKLGRLSRATTMPENDSDQTKVQPHGKLN